MPNKLSRRRFLVTAGAAGPGLYFAALPIRRANAAGKITIGVEAGSPYEKFYSERAAHGRRGSAGSGRPARATWRDSPSDRTGGR